MVIRLHRHIGTVIVALALVAAVGGWNVSVAANSPYRDGALIELVVPFSAGGGFDAYGRLLAPHLEAAIEALGGVDVEVIVRNMPGAGGEIGSQHVYRAAPNGLTLGVLATSNLVNQAVLYGSPIDVEGFTYLAQVGHPVQGLIVRRDLPAENFADVVAYSQQVQVRVATSGIGSALHVSPLLMREILADEGVDWNVRFVHFGGTAEGLPAMARGEVDVLVAPIESALSFIHDGDVRAITAFTESRYEAFPEVPAVTETGLPAAGDLISAVYNPVIIAAPGGLAPEMEAFLTQALAVAITSEGFLADAARAIREVAYLPPDAVRAQLRGWYDLVVRYQHVLREALGI